MKKTASLLFVLIFILIGTDTFAQQTKWMVGGRFGLSIGSGGGESATGLQIGPTLEALFQPNMSVGSDININTQTGTPIEWAVFYKYYLSLAGSKVKPYFNGGLSFWFMEGGPYFALRFGGGVNVPIAPRLYIPADIQLGPLFISGANVFYFAITTGIRYEL